MNETLEMGPSPSPLLVFLPLPTCVLIDLAGGNVDCSPNKTVCFKCATVVGAFFDGESMNDLNSFGHFLCNVIWFFTTLIGIFGAFANLLIVVTLNNSRTKKSFNTFLKGLALFDFLCCVFTVIAASAQNAFYQNWGRGQATLQLDKWGIHTALFFRSCSSWMTVLIALERCLVVAWPLKFGNWFTVQRNRLLIMSVFTLSFILAIPRYSSSLVGKLSEEMMKVPSMSAFEYMLLATKAAKFWYVTMKGFFDKVDFWVPLPLLLIFNGLVYYYVRQISKRRKELNMKHKKDIRAAKMFLPVIFILLACNIVPIVNFITIYQKQVIFREINSAMFLSFVVNSAVNLVIYYVGGAEFRRDLNGMLGKILPEWAMSWTERKGTDTSKATGSTGASETSSKGDNSSRLQV